MRDWQLNELDHHLRGRLVVSCQPVDDGPMDADEVVVRLAQAAVAGGAGALRIEGANRVRLVRQAVEVPVIGIIKRDLAESPVRITPLIEDVQALLQAGADIIAVDATQRVRPVPVAELLGTIRTGRGLAMADCSNQDDALAAVALGFDVIGTTLSGYTGGAVPDQPDIALIRTLASHAPRIMAEGRFNTPEQARDAIAAGAWAVTVGTAITRTEHVTGWFSRALGDPTRTTP
ncbi:N-acetylmannosamine-6-phosphate 2-epimerase [Chitinimonas sp. BJYL2]|uniref:N-acetylmannosamine-6-phosphate 2-epimerase n=1 Tax=Chitinimonas sp. BJYL2 TaxID=2976696 RepID=UPI0022B4E836|nr:putative N-acetylmannosamine-6-phosphate 2-epimerase [Chitinimonas sp. BJYL2]